MKQMTVAIGMAMLIGMAGVGCGSSRTEDAVMSAETSVTESSPTATREASSLPETPTDQTIFEYFDRRGVALEWMDQKNLTDLRVEEVAPPNWRQTDSADVPNAYALWARTGMPDGQYVPRAVALVGKLTAPVDAEEAIRYGFVDAERLPEWKRNSASLDDFGGFPSSLIEGVYMQQGTELAISNRYILANAGESQYFIQYSITMTLPQAKEYGPEAKQLKQGFKVEAR